LLSFTTVAIVAITGETTAFGTISGGRTVFDDASILFIDALIVIERVNAGGFNRLITGRCDD
jgi:hypothetical protein